MHFCTFLCLEFYEFLDQTSEYFSDATITPATQCIEINLPV